MDRCSLQCFWGALFFFIYSLSACGPDAGSVGQDVGGYDDGPPSGVTVESSSGQGDSSGEAGDGSESPENNGQNGDGEVPTPNGEEAPGNNNEQSDEGDGDSGSSDSAESEDDAGQQGSGGESGGSGEEVGADEGGGAGSGAGTSLALADSCTFGDNTTCGEGQVCASIFSATGGSDLDTSSAACFAGCASAGAPCTTATGLSGACSAFSSGFLCVAEGDLLEPCGNRMNSTCGAQAPICLTQPNAAVGVCARLCDPGNISTCRALTGNGCGCLAGQACSISPLRVSAPGGEMDGVCAPPSSAGDACGLDSETFQTSVCTSDQDCVTPMTGGVGGTCQEP